MLRSRQRPEAFDRTLRSLAADRDRGSLLLAVAAAGLIAAWGGWFVAARVPVYLTTPEARLQVEHDAQMLAAPVAGRVTEVHVVPGQRVENGSVLYRLDATVEERQVSEVLRRGEGLSDQLVSAGSELSSAAAGLRQLEALTAARVAEAHASVRAARAAAAQADKEVERAERLFAAQLTSLSEVERLRADADRQRAEAEAADRMVDRLRSEAEAERQERLVELAALEGAVSRLTAEIESAAEEAGARSAQADRFTVRAPFAGRIGEVAVRRAGAVVAVGDALATLVPDLDVQAIAFFPPAEALGRIRPGQPAELRLEAFPWAEHGSIAARVVAVEEATLEERVRVELVLVEGGRFDGPRTHGMRATALIETERRSPLHLLVRGLSRPWSSPAPASPGG